MPCRKLRKSNINQSVAVGSGACRQAEGQGVSQQLLMVQLPRPRRQDRKRGGQLSLLPPPPPPPHRVLCHRGSPAGACPRGRARRPLSRAQRHWSSVGPARPARPSPAWHGAHPLHLRRPLAWPSTCVVDQQWGPALCSFAPRLIGALTPPWDAGHLPRPQRKAGLPAEPAYPPHLPLHKAAPLSPRGIAAAPARPVQVLPRMGA